MGLIEQLGKLASQKGLSEGNRGVKECADLFVGLHRQAGFHEAQIIETSGLPGVWAYYDAGKDATLAVYAMFDHGPTPDPHGVQYGLPTGPWKGYQEVMFGHGIRTKGPYFSWLAAVHMLGSRGRLPFNVACILEGEEFIGSPHYEQIVGRHADRLRGCIGAIMPGAMQSPGGGVRLALSTKGCAYLELTVSGKLSGMGPTTDAVHGSAQGIVHSPAWRLTEALATLSKPGSWGLEINIENFYSDIEWPKERALELFESISETYSTTECRNSLPGVAGRGRVQQLIGDLSCREILLRLLYYPTLNINGLRSGYIGTDSPLFTLPGEATARIDIRFAPNQKGSDFVRKLRSHLDLHGFTDVCIRDLGTHDWSYSNEGNAIVSSALRTYEEFGQNVEVWPVYPSGAPLGVFCSLLSVPALGGVGLGYVGRENNHEYMVLRGDDNVAGFKESIAFYRDYIMNIGREI